MKESQVIKNTAHPITKARLIKDLNKLNLKNEIVLTHISLSSIGWISGGAITLIQALLESVSNKGTIVMPTQSGDNSDPADWENPPVPTAWLQTLYETMPAYDVLSTPTRNMGKTAELFRTYPGVYRSNHPMVSFAAIGDDANAVIKNHALTPMFGHQTPLDVLYQKRAKIVFIGTDYDTCTALHYAEYLAKTCEKKKHSCARLNNGQREWVSFTDYDYTADDFQAIGLAYEKTKAVETITIGQAKSKCIDFRDLIDFGTDWLLKNRQTHK